MRTLSPHEARVLATLMEKARTVPDSYPLSLNALLLGCNQKTSRDPVMELSETDAMQAIDALKAQSLLFEASSSRVARFEHNFQRGYGVNEPQAVLLGLLMLRGPQTPGELRISCERWYKFADIGGVESALEELKARADDNGAALVTQLPRAPGMREQRWAHLLCGEASSTAFNQQIRAHNAMNSIATDSLSGQTESLEQRISQLETQLAQLQSRLTYVCEELGLSQS